MDKQFDDLFRTQLEHAEVPAPEGVWAAVSGQIATQAAAGSAAASLKGLIIKGAAALLIGTTSYLAYRAYTPEAGHKTTRPQVTEVKKNQTSPENIQPEKSTPANPEGKVSAVDRPLPANTPDSEPFTCNVASSPQQSLSETQHVGTLSNEPKKQENRVTIMDNPCANIMPLQFSAEEITPSVLLLRVTEKPAENVQVIWFVNNQEVGRGAQLEYTVLNRNNPQIHLKVLTAGGCVAESDKQEMPLKGCDVENNLLIPNVFTPNADGINDPYRVLICGAEQFQLSIFERTGRRLFSTTDPEAGWDGHINGATAPEGMYIAKLRYRFYGHQEQEKTVMLWLKGSSDQ